MKKKLLIMFGLVGAMSANAQVPKMPMIEHFTQASCGPCASQNPALKTTLDAFGTPNYVRISHQVSWPGYDPMNEFFPSGPEDRRNYYGITGVPNTVLNGGAPGAPNTIVTTSTLTAAAALMTPYQIVASYSWVNGNSVSVDIAVTNVTSSPISLADKIYVSLLEDEVTYPNPPGNNGETSFEYVLRQMYNASTGAAGATTGAALGTITGNATQNFNFTIASLPSYIRDKNQISFAVYIENNAAKVVHQAMKTPVVINPNLIDVSSVSASVAGTGYCNYAFTPGLTFTNNDASSAVTSVVANYTINGGAPVSQTFTGNLSSGQSTAITFPATTLSPGETTIAYTIVSVNGGQDWISGASVSIPVEKYSKLNATGMPAPVMEGMETAALEAGSGYSRALTTGIFVAPADIPSALFSVLDGAFYSYGQIGGFANSNRNVRCRFFDIPAGKKLNLVMQKVNLSSNSVLSFDHAYRQYSTENDKLEVFISTDCGATWTSIFSKSGSNLATLPASTTSFIPSTSNQWKNNVVDLTAYNNTSDVVIRFEATSDYGNNLYYDNINISNTLSTEDILGTSFKVYPNPTSGNFTVELSDAVEANSTIEVSDLNGRILSNQVLNAGLTSTTVNTSDLAPGMYSVRVLNGTSVSSSTRVIVK